MSDARDGTIVPKKNVVRSADKASGNNDVIPAWE